MDTSFPPIGGSHAGIGGENSFWPSFTDIMMVVTMIFLMATSLLVVRNWQLVAELQESIAAERMAAQMIESTSQENATLEERLANAEQSNSILRLRMLKKDEELELAQSAIREQESSIASLELANSELDTNLQQTRAQLDAANLEIDAATAQYRELTQQIAALSQQLAQQKLADEQTRSQLEAARTQIAELSASSTRQQQNIAQLTQEKTLLNQEIEAYNQQLLTLKGDYETVKSKYEELIKPARSARGKYIAEVYYVKGQSGNVIRYRQPGDQGYSRLSLAEVEKRLSKLKQEQGANLYVKIIIPQDSGLSYSEAWQFMRNLLVKYDYYYQE
jgi:DNA repair exonuclease SbcCD ATPase subunit